MNSQTKPRRPCFRTLTWFFSISKSEIWNFSRRIFSFGILQAGYRVHWPVHVKMLRCKKVSFPSQPHKEVVYRTCSHKNHNEAISSAPRNTLQSTRDQSSLTRDVTQTQQLDNKVWNSWPIHHTFLCGFLQKRVTNINVLLLISLRHQGKRLWELN